MDGTCVKLEVLQICFLFVWGVVVPGTWYCILYILVALFYTWYLVPNLLGRPTNRVQ